MRIVLMAVVGLILGLGAGGGVSGMKAKGQILQLRADSLEQALADSALTATHAVEDGEGNEGVTEPSGHEEDQPDHDPEAEPAETGTEEGDHGGQDPDTGQAEDQAAPPPSEPPPPAQAAALVQEELDEKTGLERLGKIFMAMKARDAAAVLTHLNDMEVEAILFELREKQAAEILGNFPPDRAAVLSRSVLQKSGGFQ